MEIVAYDILGTKFACHDLVSGSGPAAATFSESGPYNLRQQQGKVTILTLKG